jgi:signal transduction histidine kinase
VSQLGRPAGSADYNLRILWPLSRWLEDRLGAAALVSALEGTGVSRSQFDTKSDWVSAEVFETILARARALMPDDETFMRACAYRIQEAYGPIRYVLWATSPGAVCAQMVKTYRLVSTVGRLVVVSQDRTRLHVRVERDGPPIGRLTCLVRQANIRALPTLWGLPVAHIREEACLGRGDATCELHMRWYAARSVAPIVFGALLFGLAGFVLVRLGLPWVPTPVFLATIGGALGYLVEVRRTERINQGTRNEMTGALRQLAAEEAEARREIVDLHHRQKEWTRLVEEQVGERTRTLELVVGGMRELQQERASTLLGFSHDLRSPLQIVQFGAELVRARAKADPHLMAVVDDMDQALEQMKRMLGDLVKTASSQRVMPQFASQKVDVPELTERLQRRLRALVHGGGVRATVHMTREAPPTIEIDPLILDRIVDNLLGNAAKYTARGGIVVELDGTPGFLVIKIADTGRGMDADQLERCFTPGGSAPELRARDSFGVGLSVVVHLLDQIGGRLEVMSQPGEGTTFWVHLPRKCETEKAASGIHAAVQGEEPRSRVVHIRRLSA